MAASVVSLNAATAVGPGAPLMLAQPTIVTGAVQVITTGPPNAVEVDLEVTLDGTNWSPNTKIVVNSQYTPFSLFFLGVRANLISLTGGSKPPTVTAIIAIA